jgi:UDP-glucose 6-dehydrogenase
MLGKGSATGLHRQPQASVSNPDFLKEGSAFLDHEA